MEVNVNNQSYIVSENCTVQGLICNVLQHSPRGLALAINEAIIPKSQWDTQMLNNGDNIVIIKATQGG